MNKIKYSRQRAKLKEILANRTDHPTAEMLYNDIRKEMPNISLGTVYRNLSLLEKNGEIIKISNGSETEHYDGCAAPHYHFSCKSCNSIFDVCMEVDQSIVKKAEKACNADITFHSTIFFGICSECKKRAGQV